MRDRSARARRSGPEDLAVDRQGNVYVADGLNNRVEKYDGNGKFLATIGTSGSAGQGQLSGPGDVTVDGQGNVYVLDAAFLQKFDPNGAFLASVVDRQWPAPKRRRGHGRRERQSLREHGCPAREVQSVISAASVNRAARTCAPLASTLLLRLSRAVVSHTRPTAWERPEIARNAQPTVP